MFIAIHRGFPIGLATLVIQAQAFFTILLARMFLGERASTAQVVGAAVGFVGMAIIGSERLIGANLSPFLLVTVAAMSWGSGNVLAKSLGRLDTLALSAWSSLAAPLPLFLLSLAFDGTEGLAAFAHPSWKLIISVLTIAYGGTVFGYGVWAWLLARHSAASVAPFALLVPVIGMIAGAVVFGETLTPVELAGAALVMAGLALSVFGDWALRRAMSSAKPAAPTASPAPLKGSNAEPSPRRASGR